MQKAPGHPFSARMTGPIAKLIVSQKDAWPIAPIIIEKATRSLDARYTFWPLNIRKKVVSLLGSRFKLTVNRSYQGE